MAGALLVGTRKEDKRGEVVYIPSCLFFVRMHACGGEGARDMHATFRFIPVCKGRFYKNFNTNSSSYILGRSDLMYIFCCILLRITRCTPYYDT